MEHYKRCKQRRLGWSEEERYSRQESLRGLIHPLFHPSIPFLQLSRFFALIPLSTSTSYTLLFSPIATHTHVHIPPSKSLLCKKVIHHCLVIPLWYGKNRMERADQVAVLKNLHVVAHIR